MNQTVLNARYYMHVTVKMADQRMENETLLPTQNSTSNEFKNLPIAEKDTPVKDLAPHNCKNEDEKTFLTEKKHEKGGIHGMEHIDDYTAKFTLPPGQKFGVKVPYPSKEAIKTVSNEGSWKQNPVYISHGFSSVVYASTAAAGTESNDVNAFIYESSDIPQRDTEANTNTGHKHLPYPLTFYRTERKCIEYKPYGCKYCIRRFAHSSSLYRHQKSHMETKLYKCIQCNKAFTSVSNLNVHCRIHTGLKPYECSDCGKKFTRKFGLDQHLKIHSQEKLYICSHCGKTYTDYFLLIKHQQMERATVHLSLEK
ncbi:uncharacterized protein [Pyxicephalus adspersus]|uniref:uncharacterized protein isoform X1 n=1 Tax=Pyxicephalus adspersus TaxID=30357 RepID=UPI003B5C9B12